MKNIVIISGHPHLSHSTANRIIIETLINCPATTAYDIMSNFPDGEINIEQEQQKLLDADLIILQFPFIWYGMPSHMKAWVEKVFSYGFAFGPAGNKLRNKQVLLSITLGGSSEAYSESGQHRHPVETFLKPLELFANYCGMNYLDPVYSYEMSTNPGLTNNIVEQKAIKHAIRVQQIIDSMHRLTDQWVTKSENIYHRY